MKERFIISRQIWDEKTKSWETVTDYLSARAAAQGLNRAGISLSEVLHEDAVDNIYSPRGR